MESREYGDPQPVIEDINKSQDDLGKRLDSIEKKVTAVYDLNLEFIKVMAGTIVMLENIGNLGNWFFFFPRKRIIKETEILRSKMLELLAKNNKVMDS